MPGTAPPASRWLLIEQPGPWGPRALLDSHLDPAIGIRLARRGAAEGVRVTLVRRPGRHPDSDEPRVWSYVDAGRATGWSGCFQDPAELLELSLNGSVGAPSRAPVYLVCAHGRHDVCCALRGRPVAEALAALRPGEVWEASHVGGDRFAANVVVLPAALYYGRVEVADLPRLTAAADAGEVVPALLRGQATRPPPVQAAQAYARRELGDTAVESLAPLAVEDLGRATWRVRLAGTTGPVMATVRRELGSAALLTCGAHRAAPPPRWVLLDLAAGGG